MELVITQQDIQEARQNGENPLTVAVRNWEGEDDHGNLVSALMVTPDAIALSNDNGAAYQVAPEVSAWLRQWAEGEEVQPINLDFSLFDPRGPMLVKA